MYFEKAQIRVVQMKVSHTIMKEADKQAGKMTVTVIVPAVRKDKKGPVCRTKQGFSGCENDSDYNAGTKDTMEFRKGYKKRYFLALALCMTDT